MKHTGHLIAKIFAILLSSALIVCCIAPIQRARQNTQEEYRDLYRYTLRAQEYYRAFHSAFYNLNMLVVKMEINGAFNALSSSDELLDNDAYLTNKMRTSLATLETIPDPGSRDLVRVVRDSFEAYQKYRDFIFSAKYDEEDYFDELQDIRARVRKFDLELCDIVYKKQ